MNIIGDVRGKVAVLVDDMIDTAGTICNAARVLQQEGAREVYACATHAVFSPPAVERLSVSRAAVCRRVFFGVLGLVSGARLCCCFEGFPSLLPPTEDGARPTHERAVASCPPCFFLQTNTHDKN